MQYSTSIRKQQVRVAHVPPLDYAGKVIVPALEPAFTGSISNVLLPLPQTFYELGADPALSAPDQRFHFFTNQVNCLHVQTLISSYRYTYVLYYNLYLLYHSCKFTVNNNYNLFTVQYCLVLNTILVVKNTVLAYITLITVLYSTVLHQRYF